MTARYYSSLGAVVSEISATLPTVELRLARLALEKAVLKVDGRPRVLKSRTVKGFAEQLTRDPIDLRERML